MELEQMYMDETNWVCFGDDEGEIYVYSRCLECGRYLKHGKVFATIDGVVNLNGWICKKHGEVEPFYDRN